MLILFVITGIAAFIALNSNVIKIPTSLFIGVVTIHAPLGIMMLEILTTITTMFLALFLYTKIAWSSGERDQSDKMQIVKDISGGAENIRINELHMNLRTQLKQQADLLSNATANLIRSNRFHIL